MTCRRRRGPSDAEVRRPLCAGGRGGRRRACHSLRPAARALDCRHAIAAGHRAGIGMRVRVRAAVIMPVAVLVRRRRLLHACSLEHGCLTRQHEHQRRDCHSESEAARHSGGIRGRRAGCAYWLAGDPAACSLLRPTSKRRSGGAPRQGPPGLPCRCRLRNHCPAPRLASKNALSSSEHCASCTPDTISARWFKRASCGML